MTNPFLLSSIEDQQTPPASANPFALQSIQNDQRQDLRNTLTGAVRENPDQAARAAQLTKRYPVLTDVIARNLAEVEKQEAVDKADEALRASPKLAQAMRARSGLAAQAHDDLTPLAALETNLGQRADRTALGTLGDVGVVALKGAIALPQAFVGLADILTGGYAGKGVEATGVRFAEAQKLLDTLYSPAQQQANEAVREADGFITTLGAMLSNPSTIATTVGESLPQMAGGAAMARGLLAAAPKLAPWLAAAFGEGLMGAGSAAEQIRTETDDGLLSAKQVFASTMTGAGTALFGAAGGKAAQRLGLADIDTALVARGVDDTTAKTLQRGFITRVAGAGISEGVFEELPQSVQEQLWQNWALDRPLGEGVGKAAAQGLLAGVATGGGFQVVSDAGATLQRKIVERESTIDRAQTDGQRLAEALQTASQSKLRARNPETFEQLVTAMSEGTDGAPQSVYIDAQVLLQSATAEELAQILPSTVEQLQAAAASNGTVEVPVAEALTYLPGTPLEQVFLQNARSAPDAMSLADADQASKQAEQYLQQEYDRVLQQAADTDAWRQSSETVKATILDQLNSTGRFTSDVNEAYAALQSNFFSTMAARMGMTPTELYDRYSLKVAAQQAGQGGVLNAGSAAVSLRDAAVSARQAVAEIDAEAEARGGQPLDAEAYLEISAAATEAEAALAAELERTPDDSFALQASTRDGRTIMLSPSAQQPGKYQLTRFDADGAPWGDTQYASKAQAVRDFLGESDVATVRDFDGRLGGAFSQFAGPSAQTADTFALDTAIARLQKGEPEDQVRRDTGWFRGADGMWRFEIADNEAKFKTGFDIFAAEDGALPNLGAILDHPKLFAAYPDLVRLQVRLVQSADFRGAFAPGARRITLKVTGDQDQMLSTLLHEIQHAIQHVEGFASGGTPDQDFTDAVKKVLPQLERQAREKIEQWKADNAGKMGAAEQAAQTARHGLMWESAQRLIDYSNRSKPSGVLRLIRNEMQWIYADELRTNSAAQELQRALFNVPQSGPTRNAYIGDVAFRAAQVLLDTIPADLQRRFEEDPRTLKSMTSALQREAVTARKALKPLSDLESAARDAYSTPFKIYQSLAGEVEARNTQARQRMTEGERRSKPPTATADVPAERVIVTFGGLDIESPAVAFSREGTSQDTTTDPNILNQGPRGTFSPSKMLLTLNENADLSTFLHESGHFFLEVMADLASQPDAPQQIRDDMAATLKWFGIKGDEQVGGADTGTPLEQRAYHGTPARDIKKFSTDFMGKGEGAQAYGWGLYFASQRDIAEWYREGLSSAINRLLSYNPKSAVLLQDATGDGDWRIGIMSPEGTMRGQSDLAMQSLTSDTFPTIEDAVAYAKEKGLMPENASFAKADDGQFKAIGAFDELEKYDQVVAYDAGQLYEVEIPEDSEMLLWDKPLSEQPKGVRTALKKAFPELFKKDWYTADSLRLDNGRMSGTMTNGVLAEAMNGFDLYRQKTADLGSDKAASEALAKIGIKGIKYLDGTSRGAGEGTFNFVIFSGDDVAIQDQFYQGGDAPTDSTMPAGRTPLDVWNAMTLDQKRPYHERWAESFEQYLFEGKAPSPEMQPLFRRFRSWMASVYKSLTQFMRARNLKLNDEVRQVFDRLLATDEQIAQAEEAAGMLPDFEATNEGIEALQARSLRDMKWTVRARGKVLKALEKEAKDLRKGVEAEVRAEVEQQPVYRAMRFFTRGELDDQNQTNKQRRILDTTAGGSTKLDLAALKEIYGDSPAAPWRYLSVGKNGLAGKEGLHPDLAADMFGFESGDQLVRAILDAEPIDSVVEGMTDQRMLERHGDLATPEALEAAANEAVHNEARAKSLATELKSQSEMLNPRQDTGRTDARGRPITVNAIVQAAKEFAANLAARRRLKDLKNAAWQHRSAEARAGKAWQAATAKGDTQAAVQAKRDQVLNNAAAKALQEAQVEVKKILEFFARVTKGDDAKTVEKGRDPDVVNAMRAILGAYDVAPRLEKTALAYMETVAKNDPAMYAALQPSVQGAMLNAKPLTEMTMEELRGLNDELRAMWALAKSSRQMEVDGNLIDIEEAAAQLVERMGEIGIPDTIPGEKGAITDKQERGIKLQFAKAILSRVEQWSERLDGKFGGPFLRLVFQPVKDAADRYRTDKVGYRKQFTELLKTVAPYLPPGSIAAPELGYTFGNARDSGAAELLHAILHTGNDSNKRKLLLGRGWATQDAEGKLDTSKWDAFMQRMHSEGKITKAHYDFAQGVWDLLEQTKPLAQKTHRKVFGRYFAEVTANEVVTPFGNYRGGYVPAQTDSRLVKDAKLRELAEGENESMAYAFPSAPSGFTKSRVEYNQPLLLDLRALGQHMDKALLFSHMQGAVTDVRRLLTNKSVSYALDRIDPGAYEGMLIPWLNRSARQAVETPTVGDRKLSRLLSAARSRAGMALMFANLSNTAQQITGFTLAGVKVKPGLLLSAAARFTANPKEMKTTVVDASPYMKDRMLNEVGAMNDAVEQILIDPTLIERGRAWTQRHAYFMQAAVDNTMSPIIWTAAYNQAIEQKMEPKDAVRFADGVIRQTQGTPLPEDISRFESGPAAARVFTQFIGYFNMMANTNATAVSQITGEMGLRKGAGKLVYVALAGLLVPIWVAEAIAHAFRGGPEDEDDDGYLDDWLMAVFGLGTLRGLVAPVPIVGQAAQLVVNRFNDNPADDKFSLSPAVSLIESTVSAPSSVYKAIVEDGNKQKAVRDVAAAATMITGLPIYGLARPIGYLAGVAGGTIEPTGPVDMARGVLTGTASPESKQR